MSAPLFDPSKMNSAKKAAGPLTVTQASAALDASIRTGFPTGVRIVGEVGGFTDRTHWYFELKDDASVLSCVAFVSVAKRSGVVVRSGMRVVVTGRFELYAKTGRVSLIVEKIEAVGQGSLAERLRALVDELRRLGWLDPARKRPIPLFPRRVAVITSKTGAALQDVLVTMKQRCPAVGVLVVDVRVQGDSAAAETAAAVREVSRRAEELGVDAVIVTRGGGSMEDLWSFNDRDLARAIVECSVPVVAAIGHETDTTVAELVADERAATPTLAATRVTPEAHSLLREVDSQCSRLVFAVRGRIDSARSVVHVLARRPVLTDPRRLIGMRAERTDTFSKRLSLGMRGLLRGGLSAVQTARANLERARPAATLARQTERLIGLERRLSMKQTLARAARVASDLESQLHDGGKLRAKRSSPPVESLVNRLVVGIRRVHRTNASTVEGSARQLEAVSPIRVLERGFSITTLADGSVVRSALDVPTGTSIDSRFVDGSVRSTVSGADGRPGLAPLAAPAFRSPRRARPPEVGPGLFEVGPG